MDQVRFLKPLSDMRPLLERAAPAAPRSKTVLKHSVLIAVTFFVLKIVRFLI